MPESYEIPVEFGTDTNKAIRFRADETVLQTHMAIFGGTRYGKSKLFELICRQLLLSGRGFAFIDPHSDTADDLLSFIACQQEELGFVSKKVVYLKPGDRLFSFDPFRYYPDESDPDAHTDFTYRSWLCTKVKDVAAILLRPRGETEDEQSKTVRRSRWLENALYSVGMRQDEQGTHLSVTDALPLLKPTHPRHQEVYGRIRPHLNPGHEMDAHVIGDLDMLRGLKSARQQEEFVESTVNALRKVMSSPTVCAIFDRRAPSIDFHNTVQRNGVILASLGKTTAFHQEESLAIAGLLIREISEAVRTVARAKRRQFYLFIDEAQNFLGEDLMRLLKESAKYRLSFGLAVQALDNLKKGEIDLLPTVLGQCGVRMTFKQQYHQDAEVLAKSLCYSMLDFAELLQEVERDDGYDFVLMPSVNEGTGATESISYGFSKSYSRGTTRGHSVTNSTQETESTGTTDSETEGENSQWNCSHGTTDTAGESKNTSWQDTKGKTKDHSESTGSSEGSSKSQQNTWGSGSTSSDGMSHQQGSPPTMSGSKAHSDQMGGGSGTGQTSGTQKSSTDREGESNSQSIGGGKAMSGSHSVSEQVGKSGGKSKSKTHGVSSSKSRGRGKAVSDSVSESETVGGGESVAHGQARSNSRSITFALTPLHKTRREFQRTGKMKVPIPDQTAMHTSALQSLEKQHCVVSIAAFNSAFTLRVADVFDPFEERYVSDEWRDRAIQKLKEQIFDHHSFYFKAEQTRLENVEPQAPPPDDPFLPSRSDDN